MEHGYAEVNGPTMYYERHGGANADAGNPPLLILHGAFGSAAAMSALVPAVGAEREVILVDLQAHGRTADIDRPLRPELMAGDVIAFLDRLGDFLPTRSGERAAPGPVDLFGYSMGSAVALFVALERPDLVRRLVLASPTTREDGFHPGVLDGIQAITPEMFAGTELETGYRKLAPRPEDFGVLVEKIKEMDADPPTIPDEAIRGIAAPALVLAGDADILTPEHAVELFRLFGGGVAGDNVGLPDSRLAILPGTTHVTLMERTGWVAAMTVEFLDAAPG